MSLIDQMMKAGVVKTAATMDKSIYFQDKDLIPTQLPILNIAFSGEVDGGFTPGISIIAGESKSFKTLLALYCMKAYFDKYPESVCLLYDSEFGSTPKYFEMFGIDISRVIHIPIVDVEEMKQDIVGRLKSIKRGQKVFILLDSLGNLASRKEAEDAENEKVVTDMTRAKAIRSMLRIVTPHITMKDLPFVMINHIYKELGLYPKNIIPGGTAVTYAANQIFIISKSQEKDGTELKGWKFTINIEKSRYVREKAKLPFTVLFDEGIDKWSAMFDLALEAGFIAKVSTGWYNMIDLETGEVYDKKLRAKEIGKNTSFFKALMEDQEFKDFIVKKYQLSADAMSFDPEEDMPDED